MRDDHKESLRKWATFLVSALALLLTCLMGPIAFTLKATVRDLVRQELTGYETVTSSDARWKAHQDYETEVLKRWEHDLAAVRERATSSETNNFKLMIDVGNRLTSLEIKLEPLLRQRQHEGKFQTGYDGP